MAASLRQFLTGNGFNPAAGVLHLLPPAVGGSVLYLFTNAPQLTAGQQLNTYRQLVPNSRLFNLIMQGDGNLVLYRTMFGRPLWASNTNGAPVDHVIMQADGNLVAYSVQGTSYWETNTPGHSAFPCFPAVHWPGYDTQYLRDTIDGQPVVIQLWKGNRQKFLGINNFPRGIGAEVGVYHVVPGRAITSSLAFLPSGFVDFILSNIANLSGSDLWWAFPELGTRIDFTLTNPVTGQTFFSAGPEATYWLNILMFNASYTQYGNDQCRQIRASPRITSLTTVLMRTVTLLGDTAAGRNINYRPGKALRRDGVLMNADHREVRVVAHGYQEPAVGMRNGGWA